MDLSQQQVSQIIQNAPSGVNPTDVLNALVAQGHTIQGYTPSAQDTAPTQGGGGGGIGNFLGNAAKGILNPLAHSVLAPYQAVKSAVEFAHDPTAAPTGLDVNVPGLGTISPANSLEQAAGNALGTAALGIPSAGLSGAAFGAGAAMANNESFGKVLEGAGLGALGGKVGEGAFHIVGSMLGGVGSKILQPFSLAARDAAESAAGDLGSKFGEFASPAATAGSDFAKAMEDQGLNPADAPAGFVNPSPMTKLAEGVAQTGPGGGAYRQAITDTVNSMRQKLINNAIDLQQKLGFDMQGNLPQGVDPEAVGQAMQDSMKQMFKADSQLRDALVEKSIKDPQLAAHPMDYTNYKQALDNIIADKKLSNADPEAAKEFEKLRANVSTAQPRTFANGFATHLDIQSRAYPRPGSALYQAPSTTEYKVLNDALNKDLEATAQSASPDLKAAFEHMKDQVKSMHAVYDTPMAKAIANTPTPSTLVSKFVKPGNIEAIRFIKQNFAPETVDQIKAAVLDQMIEKSEGTYGLGTIDGGKLATQIDKWDTASLKELFGEDGFHEIQKVKSQAILNDIIDNSLQGGEISFKKLQAQVNKLELTHPGMLEKSLPDGTYQKLSDIAALGKKVDEFAAGQIKTPHGFSISDLNLTKVPFQAAGLLMHIVGGPAARAALESDFGRKLATQGFGELAPMVKAGTLIKNFPEAVHNIQKAPIPGTPKLFM